jgi:hypothetical protein
MLDPARLDAALRRGPAAKPLIDSYREVDARRRALQGELDTLRAERNAANDRMAGIKDKKSAEFQELRDGLRILSQKVKEGEAQLVTLEEDSRKAQLMLPNAPHDSVPTGHGEDDNVVVSTWGEKPDSSPTWGFTPRDHVELGVGLGILDFERAAKISGSRFTVLAGDGARLVRALMAFMLDVHGERGYREMWVPVLLPPPRDGGHRPVAQVQGRRLPHRRREGRRRVLPGAHRRGAADQPATATRSSSQASCRRSTPPTRPASVPRRLGRPGHAGHDPAAPVRQGRDREVRDSRIEL